MASKRALFTGDGESTKTGEKLTFLVYHLGQLNYQISCMKRGPHTFTAAASIDEDVIRREIAMHYGAENISLKYIAPSGH